MQSYWNASDTGTERDGGRTGGGGGGGGRHGQARSMVNVYLTLYAVYSYQPCPNNQTDCDEQTTFKNPYFCYVPVFVSSNVPAIFDPVFFPPFCQENNILTMTMTMASAPRT